MLKLSVSCDSNILHSPDGLLLIQQIPLVLNLLDLLGLLLVLVLGILNLALLVFCRDRQTRKCN